MSRLALSLLIAFFFIPHFELVDLPDNPDLKPPTKEKYDLLNEKHPACKNHSDAKEYCKDFVDPELGGTCAPPPQDISQKFLDGVAHSNTKVILCLEKGTNNVAALVGTAGGSESGQKSVWYPFKVDPMVFGINNLQ